MGFTGWVQWRPVGSISRSVSVTIFSLQSTAKAVSIAGVYANSLVIMFVQLSQSPVLK